VGEHAVKSVEELKTHLDRLTAERQQLRTNAAEADVLERNRLEIAQAQWQLSYALIDRYLPAPSPA
jgi:FtsZ-binding cell division protein ZapB